MNTPELPMNYGGYITSELVSMFEKVASGDLTQELDEPEDKVLAMRRLVREFRLSAESLAAHDPKPESNDYFTFSATYPYPDSTPKKQETHKV